MDAITHKYLIGTICTANQIGLYDFQIHFNGNDWVASISPMDLEHGHNSLVINRYDASFYSGTGGMLNVHPVTPPINRFVYNFFFWR